MDTGKQHLLLADTPRNLVIELDLKGREVKRAGKNRDGIGTVEFDGPTDIAVNHGRILRSGPYGKRGSKFSTWS